MKQTCLVLVVAVLLVYCSVASFVGAQTDPIHAYIKAEMEKRHIPGLALAVIQHGAVIKMQGYGLANVELDVPVTPDIVFELASVTKQFTATAIMLLAGEGKVGLDGPIRHYLSNTPDAWKGITVRHLLTHTASLDQMWTPVKLSNGTARPYGFGWGVDERRDHRLISHTGITGTEYSRFPDDGLTVIVLTNLGRRLVGTTGGNSWGLTIGVAGRYIPDLLVRSLPALFSASASFF